MRDNFLDIYFHSGLSRFIEKGETIIMENTEFFINDWRPKSGYVDERTHIEIQTGFTRENFKRKQIQADKNLARKLQSRESHRTQYYQFSQVLGQEQNPEVMALVEQELLRGGRLNGNSADIRQRIHMMLHSSRAKAKKKPASKSLVHSLPVRTLTKKFIDEKKFDDEEAYIKCLICLEYYETDEKVKTLPWMHYFHKAWIESWFNRERTCPVCKWDITKDYDPSNYEQLAESHAS